MSGRTTQENSLLLTFGYLRKCLSISSESRPAERDAVPVDHRTSPKNLDFGQPAEQDGTN